MDFDSNRRDYLLPAGCKDLIDAIQDVLPEPRTIVTERGFLIVFELPKLQNEDLEVTVAGRFLHIAIRKTSKHGSVEVPGGYDIAKAQATYFKGQLCIVVPKLATSH